MALLLAFDQPKRQDGSNKKPKRRTAFATFFWVQIVVLVLVLVFGTTYELAQVISLASVSRLTYPIALSLALWFRIMLYGSIGFVIIFGFYRRFTVRKKSVDQVLKDRLERNVSVISQRLNIKKPVRPFILPGLAGAANTGRNRIVVGQKLVQSMSDQQLAGIIGHELAHSMKHHVLIKAMLFPTIVVLGFLLSIETGSAPGGTIIFWTVFAALIFAEIPLSWKMEYSADYGSAELLGKNTMIGALAYLREIHYDGPSFTHPPLSSRINRLAVDHNLLDIVFELPALPIAKPPPVVESVPEKPVVAQEIDQTKGPSYVAEPARPRPCPICGVQIAIGQIKCGSCGTDLRQWLPGE